jgi:hypothetical protein
MLKVSQVRIALGRVWVIATPVRSPVVDWVGRAAPVHKSGVLPAPGAITRPPGASPLGTEFATAAALAASCCARKRCTVSEARRNDSFA